MGFVAQSPLGSLLSGPSSSVQAFSIDREDLGEFRMELNWRDRVKLITVTPRPGYASGFGLQPTDASLSVDDHGTTKSASLDKVAKAYDDISWTTQPSAARPPSGPSAGAQRPPTPTNVTSAGRANSETFKLIQVLAPGDSDGSLYPAVSDGSLPDPYG